MNINKKILDIEFVKTWMDKGLNPIILSILNRRGLTSNNDIFNTFFPLFENVFSPFQLNNLSDAFIKIEKIIDGNKKIIISGDRDVDGVTSTVILYDFLKNIGADVSWIVPVQDEPYGLNKDKIESWRENNYSLCITVDCGITNIEEIKLLKSFGIDTIIIDHHEPLENLPDALIINPKTQKDIPFSNFAACGVVFLFIFGYLYYKTTLYNKNFAVLFYEKSVLKMNIYKNLILIKEDIAENLNGYESEQIYFYSDIENEPDIEKLIPENIVRSIKGLNPLHKILNNDILKNFIDLKLKISISLNFELFSNIGGLNAIKEKYLPLVMLGTVGDMMSLTNTNRIFVKLGLLYFKKANHQNLKSLCKELQIDLDELTAKDITWNICPVLNAPGRLGLAQVAVNFMLDENNNKALLDEIIKINEQRKRKGNTVYNSFIDKIDSNKINYNNNLAFFYGDDIDAGITGIIAAKLSRASNCPIIVAAKQGEHYTGSIRGESEYHFVDFLNKGAEIFIQFGGHKQAAGFRFHENNLNNFKDFLIENSYLISNSINNGEIFIDAEIPVKFLEYSLYSILSVLEPFGIDNPTPVFYTQSIKVLNYTKMGKEKNHLKISFEASDYPFVGIFWNKGEWFQSIHKPENKYDIIYELETNRFNNQTYLQMNILEMQKKGE